jgi:hypothetical protein
MADMFAPRPTLGLRPKPRDIYEQMKSGGVHG